MESKIIMDGLLEVTEDGKVFRLKDGHREQAKTHFISRNKQYEALGLYVNGKQKNYYVHRLVAEAFIPNPENKPQVNHKDGNPKNNHVSNLEWVTAKENIAHAYKKGLISIEQRVKPCIFCGEPTMNCDNVCPVCKKKIQHEENLLVRKAKIRDTLGNIDFLILTDLEKQTVLLRLQYKTYAEIAQIMGCSRQCVEQRIHNALRKSTADIKIRKSDIIECQKIKRKIDRKNLKVQQLQEDINLINKEISELETLLSSLEEIAG